MVYRETNTNINENNISVARHEFPLSFPSIWIFIIWMLLYQNINAVRGFGGTPPTDGKYGDTCHNGIWCIKFGTGFSLAYAYELGVPSSLVAIVWMEGV